MRIKISQGQFKFEIKTREDASCEDVLREAQAVERLASNALETSKTFINGSLVSNLSTTSLQDGDEIVLIKSKHESN